MWIYMMDFGAHAAISVTPCCSLWFPPPRSTAGRRLQRQGARGSHSEQQGVADIAACQQGTKIHHIYIHIFRPIYNSTNPRILDSLFKKTIIYNYIKISDKFIKIYI